MKTFALQKTIQDTKKCWAQNFSSQENMKIYLRRFFDRTFIHQNVFMKIKGSIFPPKYMRYGKNIRKENCLF